MYRHKIEVSSPSVILNGIETPININVTDSTILPCNVLIEDKVYHRDSNEEIEE